jgi:hypothetical protein
MTEPREPLRGDVMDVDGVAEYLGLVSMAGLFTIEHD